MRGISIKVPCSALVLTHLKLPAGASPLLPFQKVPLLLCLHRSRKDAQKSCHALRLFNFPLLSAWRFSVYLLPGSLYFSSSPSFDTTCRFPYTQKPIQKAGKRRNTTTPNPGAQKQNYWGLHSGW